MPLDHSTTAPPDGQTLNRIGVVLSVLAVAVAAFLSRPAPAKHAGPKPSPARTVLDTTTVATLFDALSRCSPSMPEGERWRVAGTVHQESLKYGYDPLFVAAMIEVESGCKTGARGTHGAVGLIQMTPTTGKAVALETGLPWRGDATLRDGVQNVRLGVRYLSILEERFSDPHLAIAAYNLGPTRVAHMSRARARNAQYVRRVLGRYQDLVELYS